MAKMAQSKKQTTDDDLALLAELGLDIDTPAPATRSPRAERIMAGFEEIERFVEEQGRLPQHGEDRDIFERLYAVRLDRLREQEECRTLLQPLDSKGLLDAAVEVSSTPEQDLSDDELLSALGVDITPDKDITQLTHVRSLRDKSRSRQEIKAAEEIAQRTSCKDFAKFKPIFKQVQQELDSGVRKTIKYQDNAAVNQGDWFILDGHKVLVADMGEPFVSDYGRQDCRLRVIYDNATESDLLLRSLQRALNKDKASRRITNPDLGPLFSQVVEADDVITGYIYVLRSQSEEPAIAEKRSRIHKIGVTTGDVNKRIANAKKDATYLLADVAICTTYKLVNINPKGLEAILHKFFDQARLDIALKDRFGHLVKPKEWFLVPLAVIDQVVEKVREGTLAQFRYNPETEQLERL